MTPTTDPSIQPTSDGSHSMQSNIYGELYHSRHGAIQESVHVFIEAGLQPIAEQQTNIRILEMGMGTALNALLALQFAQQNQQSLYYETVEAFPITEAQAAQLNYPSLLEMTATDFLQLHHLNWDETHVLHPHFSFRKLHGKLEYLLLSGDFDVVFFDAFAPNAQPELWEAEIFQKIYDNMADNGVLVTYCAKGVVKRTLKAIGFTVTGIPGPPGKREMIRAFRHH